MKKFIVVFGYFAVLNFLVQTSPILSVESSDNHRKKADKSENSILERKEHDILEENSVMEETEEVIGKWEKNADGLVVIPYQFDPKAGFDLHERSIMKYQLLKISKGTCIRFKRRTDEKDYIEIVNGDDCSSLVGKQGGKQIISMNRPGCMYKGTMAHEALHSLGFLHMHQAFDRDNYITVLNENFDLKYKNNFDKIDAKYFNYFGTSYDLRSIMHYHRKSGSKNGKHTIVPHDFSYIFVIGQSREISEGDYTRINTMYECK